MNCDGRDKGWRWLVFANIDEHRSCEEALVRAIDRGMARVKARSDSMVVMVHFENENWMMKQMVKRVKTRR